MAYPALEVGSMYSRWLINFTLGRELNEEEKYELIAAATYMHIKKEELARQFLNQDRYNCFLHVWL